MVEKIIVTPTEVRGYGNIVNVKSDEDYEPVDCTITEDTDTVYGATVNVIVMEPDFGEATTLTVTSSSSTLVLNNTVNISATLKDSSNAAISGATITFKEGTTTLGNSTTNSSGVATYTYTGASVGDHTINAGFAGDSTYESSTGNVSVTVTDHVYSISFSQSSYVASGGSATLECTLLDNNVPVEGATISVSGSDSSLYTGITNSNGIATVTVSNVSSETVFTCSYSNVSDSCTVNVQTYIIHDDATSDNSSSLFGSSISLRSGGTATASWTSANPSYYAIKNTRSSAEAFVPYNGLEGITDSFKLTIESAMHSTSNVCLIGLYYYKDSSNWGGVKAVNSEQWISSKTNGTFTEQSYQTGQSASTTKIRTEMVFDASANTLTISTYTISTDTLIQTKTMNIPITIPNDVKWGTTTTWSTNAQHDVYNIKAEYL